MLEFIGYVAIVVIMMPIIGTSAGLAYMLYKTFKNETDRYFKNKY